MVAPGPRVQPQGFGFGMFSGICAPVSRRLRSQVRACCTGFVVVFTEGFCEHGPGTQLRVFNTGMVGCGSEMNQEHENIARDSVLFASTPKEVVDALLARTPVMRVERGTTIFSQGDPARSIHIVLDGWVKLFRIAPSGTEAVVGVFTRGHSFGEAVALRQVVYPVFADAVTDCTLLRVDAAELLKHLRGNPEIAIAMLTATYAHLHNFVAQIEQLKAQTGPQRVAQFLLELAQLPVGSCSVELPYDKVLIAGRLGMKPESLSRAFTKLREQGVRIQQNSAEIDDIAALRDYAERDRAVSWHHD